MSHNSTYPLPETVLRLPEVMRMTGLGRTSIYTAMERGEFPRCISLTNRRAKGWLSSDIALDLNYRRAAYLNEVQPHVNDSKVQNSQVS